MVNLIGRSLERKGIAWRNGQTTDKSEPSDSAGRRRDATNG